MADEEKKDETKKVKKGSVTIKLSEPIEANGETLEEITFREPSAADIELCGNPVCLDWNNVTGPTSNPRPYFDTKAMSHMMSVLAAVPPSSIRKMKTRDWNTAAWGLAGFFMPEW